MFIAVTAYLHFDGAIADGDNRVYRVASVVKAFSFRAQASSERAAFITFSIPALLIPFGIILGMRFSL
ncbi:hypothetical protein O9993_11125 [Vibrio lentus]|nr:hypothetical protein [Vibrio lentus]